MKRDPKQINYWPEGRVQQTLNNIYKIRNPKTDELLRKPDEIEEFEDYYRTLYTHNQPQQRKEYEGFSTETCQL